MEFWQELADRFASGAMVTLLLGSGLLLSLRLRFPQITLLPFTLKNTVGTLLAKTPDKAGQGNISSFQAVTTALAGTMGVGNIAGVATALVAGGPGAIFWMWVSAFFGMATKYAEIHLAVRFRQVGRDGRYYGGPMYYIEQGLGSRRLACIFAFFCALCALGVGNLSQINSVSNALEIAFAFPKGASGVLAALLVALVIWGGVGRIARVTEFVIPFISILYLCCAGVLLYQNRQYIPGAFGAIIRGAFAPAPAAGGIAGYTVAHAMRYGLSRGVFTNEAGLGSAPIAHAAADCQSPRHQAVGGIFEVFLDTLVVCTVTALVLLTAGGGTLPGTGLDGSALTAAAFASGFGPLGAKMVAVSIVFYALAAMLGWCYYGECALRYLAGGRRSGVHLYRMLFVAGIVVGAVVESGFVWFAADLLNALMALPNLTALLLLTRRQG